LIKFRQIKKVLIKTAYLPNIFQRTSQIKKHLLEKMNPGHSLTTLVEKDKYFETNFNKVLKRILYPGPSKVYLKFYKG
jgi:hypothetical protein